MILLFKSTKLNWTVTTEDRRKLEDGSTIEKRNALFSLSLSHRHFFWCEDKRNANSEWSYNSCLPSIYTSRRFMGLAHYFSFFLVYNFFIWKKWKYLGSYCCYYYYWITEYVKNEKHTGGHVSIDDDMPASHTKQVDLNSILVD